MNYLLIWWLAVGTVILISPVTIWVDYRHRGKTEDSLLMQAGFLWGIRKFSVQVPVISSSAQGVSIQAEAGKKKKQIKLPSPSLHKLIQGYSVFQTARGPIRRIIALLRRGISVKRFVWHTELGINDSARLAQLTGALWAVKGMICSGLYRLFRLKNPPVLRVKPHFNRTYFRTAFTCILEFPLGYAIIAAFFAVFLVIKVKLSKRGEKNVGASNPRPNEDSNGEHQRNGGCQYRNR